MTVAMYVGSSADLAPMLVLDALLVILIAHLVLLLLGRVVFGRRWLALVISLLTLA
jgi:hypothetical protein